MPTGGRDDGWDVEFFLILFGIPFALGCILGLVYLCMR